MVHSDDAYEKAEKLRIEKERAQANANPGANTPVAVNRTPPSRW